MRVKRLKVMEKADKIITFILRVIHGLLMLVLWYIAYTQIEKYPMEFILVMMLILIYFKPKLSWKKYQ